MTGTAKRVSSRMLKQLGGAEYNLVDVFSGANGSSHRLLARLNANKHRSLSFVSLKKRSAMGQAVYTN